MERACMTMSTSQVPSTSQAQSRRAQAIPSFHGFCRQHCQLPAVHTHRVCCQRSSAVVRASAVAAPATLEVKSLNGEAAGQASLALKVADPEVAKGLVHRYLVTVTTNARAGTASTLTRAEVRGGGKKPYAQKGTGGARRGSRRSPLLPGGGISFGPKPKDWNVSMNKKERRLALATALQSAADSITVVEDIKDQLGEPKTRNLVQALKRWGVGEEAHCLLILSERNESLELMGRNVEKLVIDLASAPNVYNILRAEKIVVERSALAYLQEFYGAGEAAEAAA